MGRHLPPVTLACESCGSEFTRAASQAFRRGRRQRACSKACADAAKRIVRPTPCVQCGALFNANRNRTTYCSRECQYAGQGRPGEVRCVARPQQPTVGAACEITWRNCTECRSPFVARGRMRLCSPECRRVDARRYSRLRSIALKPVVTRTCRDCGESFVPEYGNKRRVFCGDECALRSSRRYARHTPLELERRRNAKRIRRLRPRLLAAFGGCCGICGHAIDLTLHWTHPLSLTIDHIHPVSAGGSHDETNLWPAHRRCNEEKGDDIGWSERSAALWGGASRSPARPEISNTAWQPPFPVYDPPTSTPVGQATR